MFINLFWEKLKFNLFRIYLKKESVTGLAGISEGIRNYFCIVSSPGFAYPGHQAWQASPDNLHQFFYLNFSLEETGRANRSLGEGWCREKESDLRHEALQASALPLSYLGITYLKCIINVPIG